MRNSISAKTTPKKAKAPTKPARRRERNTSLDLRLPRSLVGKIHLEAIRRDLKASDLVGIVMEEFLAFHVVTEKETHNEL